MYPHVAIRIADPHGSTIWMQVMRNVEISTTVRWRMPFGFFGMSVEIQPLTDGAADDCERWYSALNT